MTAWRQFGDFEARSTHRTWLLGIARRVASDARGTGAPMNPLSKEARDALAALAPAEPTAADERRVRQNLERALGVAVPLAAVTVATSTTSEAELRTPCEPEVLGD